MLFELYNISVIFQRLINKVLRQYFEKFMKIYLDDMIIYLKTKEDHIKYIRAVL